MFAPFVTFPHLVVQSLQISSISDGVKQATFHSGIPYLRADGLEAIS